MVDLAKALSYKGLSVNLDIESRTPFLARFYHVLELLYKHWGELTHRQLKTILVA